MEEELVIVVSRDSKEAESLCQRLSKNLKKKGLESSGPLRLPKVHITEAKRVVHDFEESEDEKHGWLNDLKRDTISSLGHAKSQMVKGYSFRFRRRVNFDGESLLNSLAETSDATVIQTTRIQKSSPDTKNAPFSYDPAQDFVTEL